MENQNLENNHEELNHKNDNEQININDIQKTNKKDYNTDDIIDSVINDAVNATKSKKKNSLGKEIFEWILVVLVALVISMIIKAFVFSTYKVNMPSMENTIHDGHNVIVYKTGYFFTEPARGDIIVFMHEEGQFKNIFKYLPIKNPGEVDYIKRVIGLPGDQIDIREDGLVYRKSAGESEFKKIDEPYVKGKTTTRGMEVPYTVPKGKLFVMGDNREQSLDSRLIGAIDRNSVIGKVVFRIWPFSEIGTLDK